jgi:hypothetical protein
MNLYRFEVTVNDGEVLHVIIAAENEESAFRLAEIEIEKHFVKMPVIKDITLYAKKKVNKGNGFVIS